MWVDEAVSFAELLVREAWGLEFAEVTAVAMVRDPQLRPRLDLALAALREDQLRLAMAHVASIFELVRVRWVRAVYRAVGVAVDEKEESYLPALVSRPAAGVMGTANVRAWTIPKLEEGDPGPVAELMMGFSVEELASFRSVVTLVETITDHPKDQPSLPVEITPGQLAHLIDVLARSIWRLETTQPTIFGPAAAALYGEARPSEPQPDESKALQEDDGDN